MTQISNWEESGEIPEFPETRGYFSRENRAKKEQADKNQTTRGIRSE